MIALLVYMAKPERKIAIFGSLCKKKKIDMKSWNRKKFFQFILFGGVCQLIFH
jgi:hypothetical protein